MLRRITIVAALVAAVLCGSLSIASTAFAGQKTSGTITVGMSWAHKNDSLFYGMEDSLMKATLAEAKKRGFDDVRWVHVICNDNAQKQASDIEDLITQGVDLIVSYAQDSTAIGASIQAARNAGIPFIMYDRDADPKVTQPDAFIGLDTTAQAYTTGVALFKAMKAAGVQPTDIISIVGDLSDQNAINRINGFNQAAKEFGVAVKQEVPSEWDTGKAQSGFSAAFQANPNSNTVLIASDFIITAVQSVLENADRWIPAGQPGHIWVASQDVFPVGLQFIRDGYIDFDGAYDLAAMAVEFAPVALDLIMGKGAPANPKVIVTGVVIDQKNVDTVENLWSRNYE